MQLYLILVSQTIINPHISTKLLGLLLLVEVRSKVKLNLAILSLIRRFQCTILHRATILGIPAQVISQAIISGTALLAIDTKQLAE